MSVSSRVYLGAPLEIGWRVEPALDTTLVTVSLVGCEVARRRVSARTGISVITERSDFFVVELDRQVPDPDATNLSGKGATTIPVGLVPSLVARFNEISWSVIVEIVCVPQASRQEFPLTVLPVPR